MEKGRGEGVKRLVGGIDANSYSTSTVSFGERLWCVTLHMCDSVREPQLKVAHNIVLELLACHPVYTLCFDHQRPDTLTVLHIPRGCIF